MRTVLLKPVLRDTAYGRSGDGDAFHHSAQVAPLPPEAPGTLKLSLNLLHLAVGELTPPTRLEQSPVRCFLGGGSVNFRGIHLIPPFPAHCIDYNRLSS